MHASLQLLLPILALVSTVVGDACVVGGPEARVSAAKRCCNRNGGVWNSKYPYQGICVLSESERGRFEPCVARFAPDYNLVCIECDETQNCGLTPDPSAPQEPLAGEP